MAKTHNLVNLVYFLNKFVKKQRLCHFYLFGVSFGAILAVYYSLKYNQKIKAIVLNGLPFHHSQIMKKRNRFFVLKLLQRTGTAKLLLQVLNKSRIMKAIYFLNNPCMKKYVTQAKMNEIYQEYCLYRQKAAKETLISILNLNLKEKVEKIAVPVLIISGQKDNWADPKKSQAMLSRFSKAQMKVIPNTDHCLIGEEPKKMSKLIKKFLREN